MEPSARRGRGTVPESTGSVAFKADALVDTRTGEGRGREEAEEGGRRTRIKEEEDGGGRTWMMMRMTRNGRKDEEGAE